MCFPKGLEDTVSCLQQPVQRNGTEGRRLRILWLKLDYGTLRIMWDLMQWPDQQSTIALWGRIVDQLLPSPIKPIQIKDSHKLQMSLCEEADVLGDGIVTYLCFFLNGRQLSYISSKLTKAQTCVMCISPTDLSLCGRMLDELWVFRNESNKSVAIIITTGLWREENGRNYRFHSVEIVICALWIFLNQDLRAT